MLKTRTANLLDIVELVEDLPEYHVKRGEQGVVVELFDDPEEGYILEFGEPSGTSSKLAYWVKPEQIKRVTPRKAKELEIVELVDDLPEYGVKKGERGVVTTAFSEPDEAYDLEFVDESGTESRFAYSVKPNQIRKQEEVANETQTRLPFAPPKVDGWDMASVSFPCREIGHDYYDVIHRKRDNRWIIALGDVSGTGVGVALLLSSVHGAVRALSQTRSPISKVMSEIDRYILENSPANKFLTLFYGELDPATGIFSYSNGGHNAPMLVRRSGEVERLHTGGLPIGMIQGVVYQEASVVIQPGDVLVLYSDGITESVNELDEEFDEARLIEVVKKNLGRSASGIRDRIDEALFQFVGTTAPVDDMTLIIAKRTIEA